MREKPFFVASEVTDQDRILTAEPMPDLVRYFLLKAVKLRASDIHFEPEETEYRIRFRIDGKLLTIKSFKKEHSSQITNELKRQFNISIGDAESPESSAAYYPEWKLSLRASKVRFRSGEKIVVRLIRNEIKVNIHEIGYTKKALNYLLKASRKEKGLVIIGGATGSGKSTTLNGLINEINSDEKNISTVEDPIEHIIHGANQTSPSENQSFSDILKEFLRQDLDVILVGEIRDKETAKLCFEAANTGHLVFTTIHANTPWSVFNRLLGLGVAPEVVKESTNLIATQKLVPKLCSHCSVLVHGKTYRLKSEGCKKCHGGFFGRLPVPEILVPHPESGFENRSDCTFVSEDQSLKEYAERGLIEFKKEYLL